MKAETSIFNLMMVWLMKKTLAVFFLVAFFGLTTSLQAQDSDSAGKYKIGVILPLSGDVSTLGQPMREAIQFAFDSLPADKKNLIEVFYEDDQMSPNKSVAAMQKLVALNGIQAVFVAGSAVGNAVAPIAEQKKIITVGLGATDRNVVNGRSFAFTHWMPPEIEAKRIVEVIKKKNYQRIGVAINEQAGIIAVIDPFLAEMKASGLEKHIVLNDTFLI